MIDEFELGEYAQRCIPELPRTYDGETPEAVASLLVDAYGSGPFTRERCVAAFADRVRTLRLVAQ